MKTVEMVMIALMAAILCIFGPITIPVGLVPVSLVTWILFMECYILGKKKVLISCLIYLAIGILGIPVFSGYAGGIGVLLGPTGGYLIGYLWLAFSSGWFIERFAYRGMHLLGMGIGLFGCYIFGTVWLMYQAQLSLSQAIFAGVLPFILFDLLKIIVALFVGPAIRKRMSRILS